jgi:sugar phosphate isomerase/epimerase
MRQTGRPAARACPAPEVIMNRREFLRTAAGAGAALGLANSAAGAAAGMYISLNSSVASGVQWPEFARLAAKTGYGGVDVNLNGAMKEGLDATRAMLAELKLRPAYCGFPANPTRDEDAFKRSLEGLEEQVKFAAAMGCARMVNTSWGAPAGVAKEDIRKMMLARFQAAAPVLAKYNVRCGFEFLGPLQFRSRLPSFACLMNEMLDFAKECGPNYGLLLDAWHWHHAGATVEDIHKAGKSRIVTIHVSDAAKMAPEDVRDNARLMPGEGVIDLVGFFRALKEIGYEDGVSPEPLGRIPRDMPVEQAAKLGYDTTRAVMRKAGIDV